MNEPLSSESLFSQANLRNFEQREALKEDLNKRNAAKDAENNILEKINAVQEALDILTKAGVPAYIHPFLECSPDKKQIRSYHNLDSFTKWENDKLDKESYRLVSQINHSFIEFWFNFLTLGPMGGNFSWDRFCQFIYTALESNRKWMKDSVEFKDVENYKNE